MDTAARARLMDNIKLQRAIGPEIAVSLDLFFDGNDDLGSIGCNLGKTQPPINEFYRVLASIRDKPEVQDVLVRITDDTDKTSWPFSDTVYILTSMEQAAVLEMVASLFPDEVVDGWMYVTPQAAPPLLPGVRPFSVWWD